MTEEQAPEMALIERLREAPPKLAKSRAAKRAGMHESRWRQLTKGYQQVTAETRVPAKAPVETLARMAQAVGATPDQLREVGREDAADALQALLESPVGDDRPAGLPEPEVPAAPTYSEYDALAAGIGVVGERLLAMNWHGDAVKAEVAMKLAQLASDIADALFSLFEESPPLRALYADAFAQSMVASRSFVAAYDQLVEPSERVGNNFDRSAGLAYGFRPGSSEKEIKDVVDDSPESGAPGQAGQTQEAASSDESEGGLDDVMAAAARAAERMRLKEAEHGGNERA